jgi:hypothetical protein
MIPVALAPHLESCNLRTIFLVKTIFGLTKNGYTDSGTKKLTAVGTRTLDNNEKPVNTAPNCKTLY